MDGSIDAVAPKMPETFWLQPSFKAALDDRHIGKMFRAYREAHTPTLTQEQLGDWVGLSQGQVSRLERALTPLRDLEKLERWAAALHVPGAYLWFRYSDVDSTKLEEVSTLQDDTNGADDTMRRRELLAGLCLSIATTGLGPPENVRSTNTAPPRRIGPADVQVMREMTASFRGLDNRFGGGHSRAVVDAYVRSEVTPILRGNAYPASIKRELLTAAAELYQLAGWMAYDTNDPRSGRANLRSAIELCQEVRNEALAAEMMSAISHHAAFDWDTETAIDLAVAARQAAMRSGVRNLHAEAAVLEAHGLAQRRDARGAIAALQRAEKFFINPNDSDATPKWLSYFDEAYLAAKFAHVLRDLGRSSDAERFARASLQMSDGYERGRLFNTCLLASTLADQHKVDEATQLAALAFQMAQSMRSSRIDRYLSDVAVRLHPHKDDPSVRKFHQDMRNRGLPVSQLPARR